MQNESISYYHSDNYCEYDYYDYLYNKDKKRLFTLHVDSDLKNEKECHNYACFGFTPHDFEANESRFIKSKFNQCPQLSQHLVRARIFRLYVLEQKNFSQIGKIIGQPSSSVRTKFYGICRAYRQYLANEYPTNYPREVYIGDVYIGETK